MTGWMNLHKNNPNIQNTTKKQARVRDFITPMKQQRIARLNNILPENIIKKVKTMPIPLKDCEDKLI